MNLTQTRATYGLRATAVPTSPTTSGNPQIGIATTNVNLPDVDVFYAIQALVVGSASDLVIDLADGDKTGSTAWTAGSPQVETATVVAAGGCTANGNLAVIVTSDGMTGTPLTVNIPLTTAAHTTAALIAQAIVEGLNANAVVAARFTATRSTAAVVLTRKPLKTYTVGSVSVPVYIAGNADDFTIPTALGVTGATSTTGGGADAGVASAGCYVVGDGEDFEGNALATIADYAGISVINDSTSESSALLTNDGGTMTAYPLTPGAYFSEIASNGAGGGPDALTIETGVLALVTIVVAGTAA